MNITIADKKKKDLFISTFQLLKNSTNYINASFSLDNLHIQGMDKSHVCLFDLNFNKEWFTDYIINDSFEICFDSNIFYSIINTKSDDQTLIINKTNEDSLSINLIDSLNNKKSDYNKFFTMPLIENDYNKMNIPATDYDAELSLPSKKVTEIFSQLSNFGDNIKINCTDDFVDFITEGSCGNMRVNISVDDMNSYSVVEGENIILNYSLLYLNKMCITNKLSTEIEFYLSKECPMKIQYDLNNKSTLIFYIAPKLIDN